MTMNRRRLLRAFAGLPLLGGLASVFAPSKEEPKREVEIMPEALAAVDRVPVSWMCEFEEVTIRSDGQWKTYIPTMLVVKYSDGSVWTGPPDTYVFHT